MAVFTSHSAQLAGHAALADYTTTGNAYADAGTFDTRFARSRTLSFAAATNGLTVQVLGSVDGGTTYGLTAVAEFTLTAGAAATEKTISTYYTNLKVQAKPTVADSHGVLTSKLAWASF